MKNLYRTALPLILAAAVLVTILCVGGVGATASMAEMAEGFNDTPAFAMDSATALAGQTVTVPLRIVHNPGIIGMRAIVTYDPAVLTPTAMEAQDFVGATFGPLSNPLSVIWFDALNPDNTTDGVVALCTFTVAEDAPAGEYPLVVGIADPDDNYNAAWQTVEFATIDGSVRVVDYVAGDANSDGKVNVRDLGAMQQYLNGWAVKVHLEASDVTGDGKVNVRDLGLLQQYLNGWDVTLEHGSGNTTSTTLPSAINTTTSTLNIHSTTTSTKNIHPTTTVAPPVQGEEQDVVLPAAGYDMDGKGRIKVQKSEVEKEGNTLYALITFANVSKESGKVWIIAEYSKVEYACYDKNGAEIATGTMLIGALEEDDTITCKMELPAGTVELKLTGHNFEYWTPWA